MAKITIAEFISAIKNMKLTEINDLVKEIEKEFNVSAAAPTNNSGGNSAEASAPTEVSLFLKEMGDNKVAVIKVAKEVLTLGLMDAKKFVESAPIAIKEGIKPEEAEQLSAKFKEAGAITEIK